MNINIYYGGRGIINDPTLYVIDKMQEILQELNVKVSRYNLHENKNTIITLPQTLKEADGVILATTVEWYGIGGYMQQFLDACWLYADKDKISTIYMCPIVMSTTYGEREGKLNLSTAWEILGGVPCSGICGYIADSITLEINKEYLKIIEKKAENLYRTINQRVASFPSSNQAVKKTVSLTQTVELTPQESEQLSQYASDDSYVQRQKEDIQELASLFRDMMTSDSSEQSEKYVTQLKSVFKPVPGFRASYIINIVEKKKSLFIKIEHNVLDCGYGNQDNPDVEMSLSDTVMDDIIAGRMTFQRAFMSGLMKMKGDFKVLRTLDQVFEFIAT